MQCRPAILFIHVMLFACFFFQSGHLSFAQDTTLVIAGDREKEGGYLVEITEEAFKLLPNHRQIVDDFNRGLKRDRRENPEQA